MRLTRLFLSRLVLLASMVMGSSVHAATQMTLYISDAQSSPVAALDKFGNVLWTERYQSYGQPQDQSTASKVHPISYTTHAFDRDSQLIYMGGRYYDAKLGRFLSVDPVEFTEDNIFSFNRYAYANNNPYAFSDPDGRNAVTAFGGVISESVEYLKGNNFNGSRVLGALQDGYNGEGAGFAVSLADDALAIGSIGFAFVGAGAAAGDLIAPGAVRFSQNSIKGVFSDGSSIESLVSGLKSGVIKSNQIPPIRVVKKEGQLFTLDNRRLEAFRRAGKDIPYRMATAKESASEAWKFTTKNGGASVKVRGE